MTAEELKVKAYDMMVAIDNLQRQLRQTNEEIAKLTQKPKLEEKPDGKRK